MPHRFHIVDVFAESLHAGNTLAVVLDAADLDAGTMQAIAREFGFSETTFVTSVGADATTVRIFTPAEELPFAGHPTLGTAWVIREHLLGARPERLSLALGVGKVPVSFEAEAGGGDVAWLQAPPVTLGKALEPERLAPALGLVREDFSRALPPQHVHAGVQFVHVPLASAAAVTRARFDLAAFEPLAREGFPPNVYLFAPGGKPGEAGRAAHASPARSHDSGLGARPTPVLEFDSYSGSEADLHARLFFVAGGVREDPATGSAAACLGAYLLAHGGHGERFTLRIAQGAELSRPSLLRLEVTGPAPVANIRVGGRVLESARGELL